MSRFDLPEPKFCAARHERYSASRLATLILALMSLQGCAMFDPYVAPNNTLCPANTSDVDLSGAVACATGWQREYRGALKTHAQVGAWTGTTLILASAAAIGLGATGDTGDTITWIGAGGAALYGTSAWLGSEPREAAYIDGMKAMSCVVSIAQPLTFIDAQSTDFDADLSELRTAIGAVRPKLRRAEAEHLNAVRSSETDTRITSAEIGRAQKIIDAGKTQIAAAEQIYESGLRLKLQTQQAPAELMAAIQRISTEVDALIAKTTADPQALPALINGLASASGMFTSLATPPEVESAEADQLFSSAAQTGPLAELNAAIEEMQPLLDSLVTPSADVRIVVAAAADKLALPTLKQCGVDDDTLAGDISLVPAADISVNNSAAFSRAIVINGGKSPYQAEILEAPINNLSISQPVPFGPRVVIRGETGVAPGSYTLHIADAAGHSKTVTITVAAAEESPASPSNASTPTPTISSTCPNPNFERDEFEKGLSDSRVACLQQALNLTGNDVDGSIGPNTRSALCAINSATNGRVTEQVANELIGAWLAASGQAPDSCQ